MVLCKETERATIALPEALPAGSQVRVVYEYTGVLTDSLQGFYRSKYKIKDANGDIVERYMATTQFEPVSARRALPCWDEPLHKATYEVTLVVPKELTALSNTKVVSETVEGALKTVAFERTPVMSTYLLAFVVGEFEYVEKVIKKVHSKEDTTVRVYTLPGQKERGLFSLDCGAQCLTLFEEFFGVDYVLDKCDMIAIPDFAAGAMENWGLITYRETALLCDDNSSAILKMTTALVVCHELAHQWFGNLVTMKWWNELWLNESFASYMQFYAVNELYPEWKPWSRFVANDFDRALNLDSLASSHPVEVDVREAAKVMEIFDAISYSKGCSVMRMVTSWIGPDNFKHAMQKYIKKHAYSNATTVDLWTALEEESKQPVTKVMHDWTSEQGYPVLRAKRVPGGVEVTQTRFLLSRKPTEEEARQAWSIPMQVGTDKGVTNHLVEGSVCVLPIDADAKWVKLNWDQTALCRVAYSDEMLADLEKVLGTDAVGSSDKMHIIGDVAALAKVGHTSAANVFRIAACFANSEDVDLWTNIFAALSSVRRMLRGDTVGTDLLDAYLARFLEKLGESLGWDHQTTDSHRRKQLRGSIIPVLASAGHPTFLKEARRRFDAYVASRDDAVLSADLRGGVFRAVLKADQSREAWDAVRTIHETTTDAADVVRCLGALGATRNPDLLDEALLYAFSDKVRSQNTPALATSIALNALGEPKYLEYFIANQKSIFTTYVDFVLTNLCKAVSGSDFAVADRIEEWWNNSVSDADRKVANNAILQAIESIRITAAYKARSAKEVVAYLQSTA